MENNFTGKSECSKKYWAFLLLLIPLVSSLLALRFHNFSMKAGVAGGGILVLLIVYARSFSRYRDVFMIFGAFLFSIMGDWFLSNRHGNEGRFIAGIALFFIAHSFYLAYSLLNGRIPYFLTVVLLIGYFFFFFFMLSPAIRDNFLLVAVLCYLLISCFSMGAASGIRGQVIVRAAYIFGIGMVLFSDTIIALREFANYDGLSFLILPTYYLAQISVTFSLMSRKLLLTVES